MRRRTEPREWPFDREGLEVREGLEGLTARRIITLYRRAPLRRPMDAASVWRMFEASNIVVSVWLGSRLVGLARALSDGGAHAYLCDLAVEPDYQGRGIGRALLNEVLDRSPDRQLVLRDTDISTLFFNSVGAERITNAWQVKAKGGGRRASGPRRLVADR